MYYTISMTACTTTFVITIYKPRYCKNYRARFRGVFEVFTQGKSLKHVRD